MCPGSFLEVCVDSLDQDGLGLLIVEELATVYKVELGGYVQLTWIFALQSEVMLVIFDPVTPGALRASIDCKIASSSSTQDDMVESLRSGSSCTSSLLSHRTMSAAATLQSRTQFQSL